MLESFFRRLLLLHMMKAADVKTVMVTASITMVTKLMLTVTCMDMDVFEIVVGGTGLEQESLLFVTPSPGTKGNKMKCVLSTY